MSNDRLTISNNNQLTGPEDYYLNEDGLMVFTAKHHLRRGYCCESGCRHCPYGFSGDSTSKPTGEPSLAGD